MGLLPPNPDVDGEFVLSTREGRTYLHIPPYINTWKWIASERKWCMFDFVEHTYGKQHKTDPDVMSEYQWSIVRPVDGKKEFSRAFVDKFVDNNTYIINYHEWDPTTRKIIVTPQTKTI